MNFGTAAVGEKFGNIMDWTVGNAYKNVKDMENKSVHDAALIPNLDIIAIDTGVGTSERGDSIPALKPRKKTMTSIYLKFFETATDGKSRRCKFCGQSYSIATATGNLGRHLSNRHPGYEKSGDVVTSPNHQPVTIAKKPPTQARPPQLELEHLNWLVIKWLILASLPPSTLEERWLTNSFKFLNPSINLWPGEKFQGVLLEVFRSMREDVRTMLSQVSSKVSVTLDFWTSYEQIVYMSITSHWIDENWCFHKVLLDVCHVPSPCGDSEIYQKLVKVLSLYNIENRVLCCTHDNSPNALQACHKLKEDMDTQKVSPFCYIPCAARTLNLIINDALITTKSVISKIREVVLEMNARVEISETFIQYATIGYQEGSWKFPLDSSVRWSGNYHMLDIARKASKSIEMVTRKYEDTLGSKMVLNPVEKNAVTIMHTFLEPFYKTTTNMCVNEVPTVGLVLFFMDNISETIAACRETRQNPDWLKNAAEEMSKKADNYNDQIFNTFTYMTSILDPRIKVDLIPESLNTDGYLDEARSYFTAHFMPMVCYGGSEVDDGGGMAVSFAEEIARKKRRASMGSAGTDELTQYLSEPTAPISTDVLEWWKVNSSRYPRLSVMARDFLAVQATSLAPEELFCSKGDEIDKQRFAVPHENMQSLLCVRSWTQCGIKLKYKSTEIDYERLMELATENNQTALILKDQNDYRS